MQSDTDGTHQRTGVAVLGATGSIGVSTIDVLKAHPERLSPVGLTAHTRWEQLAAQAKELCPQHVVLTGLKPADIPANAFPAETKVSFGPDAVRRLVADDCVETVISGIVGAAGLEGTWAALEAGKRVGLANKETFVVAGPLVNAFAREHGSEIIPVDSEHNAIYQALRCGQKSDVRRIILTASGGPFRSATREEMAAADAAAALAHPTWDMGPKITVDSATMMNKALEVIEARWLFELEVDRIEVVVHPQSIVHSMVEFQDGSVIAQMSPPDMRLPIQYALTYPDRLPGISPTMDFTVCEKLEFAPPDLDRFPALGLGFEVARQGGTAGAVLNAANEVAVERFLSGGLAFTEIPELCRDVLAAHHYDSSPTLEVLLDQDRWARLEAFRWKSCRLSPPTTSTPSKSSTF